MMQWNDVLAGHLHSEQIQRLDSARIGIVGAGGLGSNCAMVLARCGIRQFVVMDFDSVSVSNLNRQFFRPSQVGLPKVDALRCNLEWMLDSAEPALQFEGHQRRFTTEHAGLFVGCDVVVEAVDDPETKRLVVQTTLDAGHTVVSASGMAGWGLTMTRKRLGKLTVVGDLVSAVGKDGPPMAPGVLMAAAMQADEVIWQLLGEGRGRSFSA